MNFGWYKLCSKKQCHSFFWIPPLKFNFLTTIPFRITQCDVWLLGRPDPPTPHPRCHPRCNLPPTACRPESWFPRARLLSRQWSLTTITAKLNREGITDQNLSSVRNPQKNDMKKGFLVKKRSTAKPYKFFCKMVNVVNFENVLDRRSCFFGLSLYCVCSSPLTQQRESPSERS
jgi:hypothetical protein